MAIPGINSEIKFFNSGTHNLLPDTVIPTDAASDSKNWLTKDGRIVLAGGRAPLGAEGTTGAIYGEIFGYKRNGTVHWRKDGSKIQYWDGSAWQDTITGLTATADYTFSNYSSLAGDFTFAFGVDGIFKMHNANPGSYIALYSNSKNFKGYGFIDRGRTILWNRPEDKTGIYGSYIDAQDSTVYTSVTGEATTSLSGTLAFKGSNSLANCFGVAITITGSGQVFTDNGDGTLTGSAGGTGTINYITGAYTLSASGVGTAAYQWENSNSKGVTDFTHSSTRLAGEGFQFPQDEGGDPIMCVLIGPDLAYYSLKVTSAYRLSIDADDLGADNNIFRRQIGIKSLRGAFSIQIGIIFMNTANPDKPELTILQKNELGGNVEPAILFPQFKFANYDWSDCTIDTSERYVLLACKAVGSITNDTILLANVPNKTIDITSYPARTFAKDSNGTLYAGSPLTGTVYSLYDGFDDDGLVIDNYWTSKGENFQPKLRRFFPAVLKKHRRIRVRGTIGSRQSFGVYIDYDDAGPQLVGTVLGSASYVDNSSPQAIGGNAIGGSQIGGDGSVEQYPYFAEIRIKKPPKFMKRKVIFRAFGFGYLDIEYLNDWGLQFFEDKLPARFRQKQNVSLDGTETNLPNPQF